MLIVDPRRGAAGGRSRIEPPAGLCRRRARRALQQVQQSSPAGQGPKPDSVLICPAWPMPMRRLPQACVKPRNFRIVIQGSLLLATTRLGKPRSCLGRTAARVPAAAGPFACSPSGEKRPGSAGATSMAPAIRGPRPSTAASVARQPKLCATSQSGPGERRTSRRTAAAQVSWTGASQSISATRRTPLTRDFIQVCQCLGPLPWNLGTISVLDSGIVAFFPAWFNRWRSWETPPRSPASR